MNKIKFLLSLEIELTKIDPPRTLDPKDIETKAEFDKGSITEYDANILLNGEQFSLLRGLWLNPHKTNLIDELSQAGLGIDAYDLKGFLHDKT